MAEYTETWKRISTLVGKSERWCRYMAHRPESPLPVFKVGGMARINHVDYQNWLEAQNPHAKVATEIAKPSSEAERMLAALGR
jgi:hypothetical protein